MNDKWFNIAMIIIFTSLVANGLVFMLVAFPGGNQFTTLYKSNLSYDTNSDSIKDAYKPSIAGSSIIAPGASDSTGTGFTPLTNSNSGNPVGLDPVTLLGTAFVGLEILLLSLANIFTMFAFLFILFALLAFIVKVIVIAYLGSLLIRAIFGGRT